MAEVPKELERILAARALAPGPAPDANARAHDEQTRPTVALASFHISGKLIAVPLTSVTRAAALRHLTDVPGGPSWVVGLIAVDGHLLSLLHLGLFLGLPDHGVRDLRGILVVASGGREIGLAAEQLLGIEDVPEAQIEAQLGAASALNRIARVPQGARVRELLVLDVDELFNDPRLGRG
jgi:purine-binding chemotaxis protein CheW